MTNHQPLPVAGYTEQSDMKIDIVNINKRNEERILREIDKLKECGRYDGRWLAIATTHFEQAYMAFNRAIFQPQRIVLPEDAMENKS